MKLRPLPASAKADGKFVTGVYFQDVLAYRSIPFRPVQDRR